LLKLGFLLAGIVLASAWLSHLAAPRPRAALPSTPAASEVVNLKLALRLFGSAEATDSLPGGFRLTGIYRTANGAGFATFQTAEGGKSAAVGGEIMPGLVLQSLEDERVMVVGGGNRHEMTLPRPVESAPLDASASPEAEPASPSRLTSRRPSHRLH